jgi:hypothetical protein
MKRPKSNGVGRRIMTKLAYRTHFCFPIYGPDVLPRMSRSELITTRYRRIFTSLKASLYQALLQTEVGKKIGSSGPDGES